MDTLHVVDDWQKLVAAAGPLLLFLDFDGTLAHIVSNPEDAQLPKATQAALLALSEDPDITLVFISGRRLEDLRRRVAIAGAIYAGNHGMEIEGRGLAFIHPAMACAGSLMRTIERQLQAWLAGIPGVIIEDKGSTLSLHYRQVQVDDLARVAAAVQEIELLHRYGVERITGREVFEFRPRVGWNKGSAAQWIRERVEPGALMIYVGDDRTDEDAFQALDGAVTFHSGQSSCTAAKYRLEGPDAVQELLTWLARRKALISK